MNIKLPELLAPAGGMESAIAAINAGADAIYLGGKNFSARSSAQNFTDDEIINLIEFAAVRDVRVYIAVNTLYKNAEIPQVVDFVTRMHSEGAAAFILQDPGLAYILKDKFPQVEIHASTQMSVHSTEGVLYMEKMGFSRVVLARELSLAEIAEINAVAGIETEVFIHGALCVSYSGQCLMSSLIGSRSGNRGKCAQICRTRYTLVEAADKGQAPMQGCLNSTATAKSRTAGSLPTRAALSPAQHSGYLLSPKDMMTLDILDKIIAAGAASLKIEGRMKSPEYVYLVTKAYRERLDALGTAYVHWHNNVDAAATAPDNSQALKQSNAQRSGILPQPLGTLTQHEQPRTAKPPMSANPIVAANKQNLLQIFNRGGSFSTGYYQTYAGSEMMSTVTPKSTGTLIGIVTAYTKGRCKIKFSAAANPGDGIEIWTSDGNHVGTGISKAIAKGESIEFVIKGAIEKGNPVYKSYDHGLISATKKEMAAAIKKRTAYATVRAITDKPVYLSLSCGGARSDIYGDVIQAAINAPMSSEEVLAQLSKTGNTPFEFKFAHAEIGENIFVNRGLLNEMRRRAVEELEKELVQSIKRDDMTSVIAATYRPRLTNTQKLSVQLNNIDHLPNVLNQNISRVYIPAEIIPASIEKPLTTEIFVTFPHISRNCTEATIKAAITQWDATNIDGYLVSTYGQLNLLRHTPKKIMLNHTFNIFNHHAVEAFSNMEVTLSQELNTTEIKSFALGSFELIVYGRQTLMATHNCPIGLYLGRKNAHNKTYALRDKINMHFPIQQSCRNCNAGGQQHSTNVASCAAQQLSGGVIVAKHPLKSKTQPQNCIAYILNSKTLDTAQKFHAIKSSGATSFRLIFTDENEKTIFDTISRYQKALAGETANASDGDTTYGHFFRGVE